MAIILKDTPWEKYHFMETCVYLHYIEVLLKYQYNSKYRIECLP